MRKIAPPMTPPPSTPTRVGTGAAVPPGRVLSFLAASDMWKMPIRFLQMRPTARSAAASASAARFFFTLRCAAPATMSIAASGAG